MTNWIIPANTKYYDVLSAFDKLEILDWSQKVNFEIGDIIYIYVAKPYQKVLFKTIAIDTNIEPKNVIDDREFHVNIKDFFNNAGKKYVRLKKLAYIDDDRLTLKYLLENGLKNAPQGAIRIVDSLQEYIDEIMEEDIYDPNEINENQIDELYEGATQRIFVNRYERNKIARDQCLAYHGYNCKVCGMNFEETYGEVGKGFIHVHHLVPLSEINEEYKVDPINDLIPVCPNCHGMLHRKVNGKYLSVQELKQLCKQK